LGLWWPDTEKHKWRRQAAFVLVKMVLRHPRGIKAAAFGIHDLRDGQAIALGRIRPVSVTMPDPGIHRWRYQTDAA